MPNWKKVIVSGSNAFLNNITSSGNISGSATSTASFGTYLGDGSQLTGITSNPFPLTASSAAIISRSIAASDTDSTTLRLIGSSSISQSGIFEVEGSAGPLFSVADGLDGILMEVNNISGLPLFQVSSSNEVFINRGNLTSGVNTATASFANFSGSFQGDGSNLTNLPASNPFPFTGDAQITGSLTVSGSGGVNIKGPFELSMTGSSGNVPFKIKTYSDSTSDNIIEIRDDGGAYDLFTFNNAGQLNLRNAASGIGGGFYINDGGVSNTHAQLTIKNNTGFLSIKNNGGNNFTVDTTADNRSYLVGLTGNATMAIGKAAGGTAAPSEANTNTISIFNGTNPTSVQADGFAFFSNDVNSAAGTASPTFLTEDGTTIQLGTTSSLSYISASAFSGDGSQLTGISVSTPTLQEVTDQGATTTNDIQLTGSLLISGSTPKIEFDNDIVIQQPSTTSGGIRIGYNAQIYEASLPQYSIAIGHNASDGPSSGTNYDQSVAIGRSAIGGYYAVAIGGLSDANGYSGAVAIGASAQSNGNYGMSFGFNAQSAASGISIGKGAISNQQGTITIGTNTTNNQTRAIVLNATTAVATNTDSKAFKTYMSTQNEADFAIIHDGVSYINGTGTFEFRNTGGIISTGSLTVSGSKVDFTDATAISGSTFSGSFVGDGSGLTGISVSTPTLQQVVDQGSSTTTAITASAISSSALTSAGDLTLDADGADILLKDGGTEFGRFKRDNSNFIIKSATQDKDIVFRGNDGGGTVDALTLDMSDGGKGIFTAGLTVTGSTTFNPKSTAGGKILLTNEGYSGVDNPIMTFQDGGGNNNVVIGHSANDGLINIHDQSGGGLLRTVLSANFSAFDPGSTTGFGTFFGLTSSMAPTVKNSRAYIKIYEGSYSGAPAYNLQLNHYNNTAGSGSIGLYGIMSSTSTAAPAIQITSVNAEKVVNFGGPGFIHSNGAQNNYLKYGLQIGGDFTGQNASMALTDGSLIMSGSTGGFSVKSVSSEAEIKTNDGSTTLTLGTTSSFTAISASSYISASAFIGDGSNLTNLPAASAGSTAGRVVFTTTDGALTTESGFDYDSTTNQLTVESLNVTHFTSSFITSSRVLSSGSNILGDEVSDTQTLIGTTKMTGSAEITGSLGITNELNVFGGIRQTSAAGANVVLIGNTATLGTTANAEGAVAIGDGAFADMKGIGIGEVARAGLDSITIGAGAGNGTSTGRGSIAIGINARPNATAISSITLAANDQNEGTLTVSEPKTFGVYLENSNNDAPDLKFIVGPASASYWSGSGFFGINTKTPTSALDVRGTISGSIISGSHIGDGSGLTGVDAFPFTGDAQITGSLTVSSSNSTASLTLEGSGSTVFEVIGSEGTLFSIDDDLDGTIFTANDRSGLPVLEASASGEVYIGKTPQSLYTTAVISSTTAATTQSIFGLSTSSYGGAFFDYTVQSGSDARAGSIMSVWNGGNISFTETTTTDIGDTTDFNVIVHISQSQAQIASHATKAGYNIKTIIRSI